MLLENIKCSIDRIVITGDSSSSTDFKSAECFDEFGFIVKTGLAKYPYKKNFYCIDGSLLQWTDERSVKALRLEFNPNNIRLSKENEHRRSIVSLLRLMKYAKFTRFDIAFDLYGVDLGAYLFKDFNGRKSNVYRSGNGDIETIYMGAADSDLRLRIYDKATEQGYNKGRIKDGREKAHWWRIEAQYRSTWCMSMNGEIEDKKTGALVNVRQELFNPFEGVKIYKPSWRELSDVKERALIRYFLQFPEEIQELSKNAQTKYRKIIKELPASHEIDLRAMFEKNKEQIERELLYWLRFAHQNNVL